MHPIDQWLAANNKFFPSEKIPYIRECLMRVPEQQMGGLYALSFKDPTMMLIVSILVGEFGVDRFMLGDTGLGVLKLLTFGGCLVWWIIDIFLVQNKTRDMNFDALMQALQMYGTPYNNPYPPQQPPPNM